VGLANSSARKSGTNKVQMLYLFTAFSVLVLKQADAEPSESEPSSSPQLAFTLQLIERRLERAGGRANSLG
jgi:hypothetical protein